MPATSAGDEPGLIGTRKQEDAAWGAVGLMLRRRHSGQTSRATSVTLGVADKAAEAVLTLAKAQPFVREASRGEGVVRLYVEHGETAVPQLLRLLDGAGLSPTTIAMSRPSLDDVFLRKTGRSLREDTAAA